MNYELAKKLKEAGFPQPNEALDGYYCDFIRGEETRWRGLCSRGIYIPTLSELIGAVGNKFGLLEPFYDKELKICDWSAFPRNWENTEEFLEGKINQEMIGYGNTPEEAVAHLWLALNKK